MSAKSTGSRWHKWDLHCHTPASFDYKDKGATYKNLADAINKTDLDAVAVTDHWTFDGYKALLPMVWDKLLIPGMELRTDKSARSNPLKTGGNGGTIQAVVLFPPSLDLEEIEKNFLHQINLCERDSGLKLTRKDLIELGKKHSNKTGLQDEDYHHLGCAQAYVDYLEITKQAHSLGGLVCLTYEKHGGFDAIDPINDSIFKSNLVIDCDLIETGKENIRQAFFEHPDILKACGKKTPCFKGSDAHSLTDVAKRFTWIKSELSFDGLRQVKYFPRERVSFAEQRPTYSYPRIKRVCLTNLTDHHPLDTLVEPIEFNDNLNSIIGHPSIGKSTLAELIAYTFDQDTKKEEGEAQTKIENLQSVNPNLRVEVEVAIGATTSTISRTLNGVVEGGVEMHEFPIVYVNQGYIDRTARDASAVNELVTKKLNEPELARFEDQIRATKRFLKTQRTKYLGRFTVERELIALNEEIAKTEKLSQLSESTGYKELNRQLEEARKDERALKSTLTQLKKLEEIVKRYSEELEQIKLTPQSIGILFPSLGGVDLPRIESLADEPLIQIEALIKRVEGAAEFEQAKQKREKVMHEIKTLFEKEGIVVSSKKLEEIEKLKESLNHSLIAKDEELKRCVGTRIDFDSGLGKLMKLKTQYEELNSKSLMEFNKGLEKINATYEAAELEPWLIGVLTSEAKEAWEEFTPGEDKKAMKFKKPSDEEIKKVIGRIQKDKKCDCVGALEFILKCLDQGTLPFKDSYPPEHIKWLFGINGSVVPEFLKLRLREFADLGKNQVYYDGKNISTEGLSFTERCGALLEVFMQKGEEPLLIDQPEENLGAGYVAKVLTEKLLEKKTQRQIIVISHNPNTVVLADSDVVVALDHGENDEISLRVGAIETPGMQDVVCNIIEGGREAFKLRYERYKIVC